MGSTEAGSCSQPAAYLNSGHRVSSSCFLFACILYTFDLIPSQKYHQLSPFRLLLSPLSCPPLLFFEFPFIIFSSYLHIVFCSTCCIPIHINSYNHRRISLSRSERETMVPGVKKAAGPQGANCGTLAHLTELLCTTKQLPRSTPRPPHQRWPLHLASAPLEAAVVVKAALVLNFLAPMMAHRKRYRCSPVSNVRRRHPDISPPGGRRQVQKPPDIGLWPRTREFASLLHRRASTDIAVQFPTGGDHNFILPRMPQQLPRILLQVHVRTEPRRIHQRHIDPNDLYRPNGCQVAGL